MEIAIRDFYGLIVGYLEKCSNGDIIAKNRSRQILGRYRYSDNRTVDFYGKILFQGDMSQALLVLYKQF